MNQKVNKETRQKADSLFEAIAGICKDYNDRVIVPAQKKSLSHQHQHQ